VSTITEFLPIPHNLGDWLLLLVLGIWAFVWCWTIADSVRQAQRSKRRARGHLYDFERERLP
jgi:hypothetical protein